MGDGGGECDGGNGREEMVMMDLIKIYYMHVWILNKKNKICLFT